MSTGGPVQPSQTFDLSNLAESADRARRFRVAQSRFVRGLGLALMLVGALFYVAPPAATLPRYSSGPLIFIVIGPIVFAAGYWVSVNLGPSARRLIVSAEGISLENIPRRPPVRLEWEQTGFRLEIHDFRDIRKADPKSRSHGYEIVLHLPRGPETAIPPSAYEAILRGANVRGLRLNQRPVKIGARAPMIVTTIRNSS